MKTGFFCTQFESSSERDIILDNVHRATRAEACEGFEAQ